MAAAISGRRHGHFIASADCCAWRKLMRGRSGDEVRQGRRVILERVKGIEPSYSAWKAAALPLSYTRAPPINYHASMAASTAMR
jgi:hypothetical protein